MELPNLALSLTYSTAGLYFFQTLPKIAKNIFRSIKKDDFCLDWLRNKNSIIKFTVPGNIFNQVARYSGVPWYSFRQGCLSFQQNFHLKKVVPEVLEWSSIWRKYCTWITSTSKKGGKSVKKVLYTETSIS